MVQQIGEAYRRDLAGDMSGRLSNFHNGYVSRSNEVADAIEMLHRVVLHFKASGDPTISHLMPDIEAALKKAGGF